MSELTPAFLTILLALSVTIVLFSIMKKKTREKIGTFDQAHADLRVKDQLDELFVQIQETVRDNIARLDTKIRVLHRLVEEADDKIRALEALRKVPPPSDDMPSPAPAERKESAPPPPPERPSNPLHDKIYTLHDAGKPMDEISQEVGHDVGEIRLILGLREVKPKES